jgi:hypothetical protein
LQCRAKNYPARPGELDAVDLAADVYVRHAGVQIDFGKLMATRAMTGYAGKERLALVPAVAKRAGCLAMQAAISS